MTTPTTMLSAYWDCRRTLESRLTLLEEKLLQLLDDGTCKVTLNSKTLRDLPALRESLAAIQSTLSEELDRVSKPRNIARKKVTLLSAMASGYEEEKIANLLVPGLMKSRKLWIVATVYEVLLRRTLLFSCGTTGPWKHTLGSDLNLEIFGPSASGYGDPLAQERADLLCRKVRHFAEAMLPGFHPRHYNGSNPMLEIKELCLTILMEQLPLHSCSTYWTTIPCLFQPRADMFNGGPGLSGLQAISALSDCMATRINTMH